MSRNSTPQRRIERTPWRPGAYVSDSGAILPPQALPKRDQATSEGLIAIAAIELTMVCIARAMAPGPGEAKS